MAFSSIPKVRIAGLAASVPKHTVYNMECTAVPEKDRKKLILTTGIEERRIVNNGLTAADLCKEAALRLMNALGWKKEEIELLVFVSQTPDYLIPCTSTILQDQLGLSKNTVCIDINLGCSGYVYGLANIASQLAFMPHKKALLLVGDTSSICTSNQDKSVTPLFSDAGSATALEYSEDQLLRFNLQSDGGGFQAIWIPDGGARNGFNEASGELKEIDTDIKRSQLDLILNGIDVFNFSMREVAPNIKALLEEYNLDKEEMDYFIFHQANKLLNDSIRKKLGISRDKMPLSLQKYGNTSSASIPVTLVSQLRDQLQKETLNLIFSGFGVGLSWASAHVQTDKILCLPMIEL